MQKFSASTLNLWLLLITLLSFTACKKDPDPKPDQNGKKDLISKVWKVHKVVVNNVPDQGGNYDGYRFEFKKDGTYSFAMNGETGTGQWEFTNNDQKIVLDKGTPNEMTVNILTLTETELDLEFIFPANGKNGESTVVFKLKP